MSTTTYVFLWIKKENTNTFWLKKNPYLELCTKGQGMFILEKRTIYQCMTCNTGHFSSVQRHVCFNFSVYLSVSSLCDCRLSSLLIIFVDKSGCSCNLLS